VDLPRSGRPPTYGARERALVVATVCETLHEHKQSLSRFSISDLHRIVIEEEGLGTLSHSSLARILDENVLKPWQYTYWLFPRDPVLVVPLVLGPRDQGQDKCPGFVSKACVVLDLYAGFWKGQRLGPDEFLLSSDEKTIQVLISLLVGSSRQQL